MMLGKVRFAKVSLKDRKMSILSIFGRNEYSPISFAQILLILLTIGFVFFSFFLTTSLSYKSKYDSYVC
jgi:hypothetical protein